MQGFGLTARGPLDERGDSGGLWYIDGGAALNLGDGGTGPVGHEALRQRGDHLVLGRDQVPARLRFPRRFVDRAAEGRYSPRHLRIRHERSLFWVDVRREGSAELRSVEEQVSVLRRQDRRHRRVGGRILD